MGGKKSRFISHQGWKGIANISVLQVIYSLQLSGVFSWVSEMEFGTSRQVILTSKAKKNYHFLKQSKNSIIFFNISVSFHNIPDTKES